jgi:glycosyltransferase involved in cell wall biosynthesis
MKIALVTAFPPSRQGLNEYGFHVADELRRHRGVQLTILADYLVQPELELPNFSVVRCWGFNRLDNPLSLLSAIRTLKPDIVWYNLGFASFGGSPLPAFFGLTIPALTRLCSCYTHITLHQLFETVNLADAGVKSPLLYSIAGRIATHVLLCANSMSVLLPAYHRTLRDKYGRGVVKVRHHGIFASRPEQPDLSKRGNPVHRILAFGKWGTYKRLELLIAAFERVASHLPNVELVIAGGDHPKTPGYVSSVAERVQRNPLIRFVGYVPEQDIPALFQGASLAAMPYTSSAGSSGVAHLACQYGLPILAADIEDFRELAEHEGVSMDFFVPNNVESLADHLSALLQSPEQLIQMAQQNFTAALQMSMPQVIRQYIRSFDLQHRLRMLRAFSQLRNSPRWMPTRNWMARRLERKLQSWYEPDLDEASPRNPQ